MRAAWKGTGDWRPGRNAPHAADQGDEQHKCGAQARLSPGMVNAVMCVLPLLKRVATLKLHHVTHRPQRRSPLRSGLVLLAPLTFAARDPWPYTHLLPIMYQTLVPLLPVGNVSLERWFHGCMWETFSATVVSRLHVESKSRKQMLLRVEINYHSCVWELVFSNRGFMVACGKRIPSNRSFTVSKIHPQFN